MPVDTWGATVRHRALSITATGSGSKQLRDLR